MLSKAFHSFLLSVITISAIHSGKVVNAQSPLPSCTSLSVTSYSDCSTACSNKGETLLGDFRYSAVGGVVLECGCSTSKVCDDEDVNAPLPSCTSLSVTSAFGCGIACSDKGETFASFSDDNGVECACSTSKVCEVVYEDVNAPLPSCTSLGVTSQSDCSTACLYKGEFSGDFREDNGVVECACSTSKVCEVVYEDVNAPLPSCTSLSVTNYSDCSTACSSKGETLKDFRGLNEVVLECGCSTSKVCGDGDFVRSAAGDRTVVVATIMCLSAMTLMV